MFNSFIASARRAKRASEIAKEILRQCGGEIKTPLTFNVKGSVWLLKPGENSKGYLCEIG
jgi:hypothetical protein